MVPKIDFQEVQRNGGKLPNDFANLVRDRGCVVLRNIVPESQAVTWESELKDYTRRHRSVGGFPKNDPQNWSLWWTPPQVQIRSDPRILEAMKCQHPLSCQRLDSPNRPCHSSCLSGPFRLRHPSKDAEYTLSTHLDSGAIERWECPQNQLNYQAIFEGNWGNWDGWVADKRHDSQSDMYHTGASCSCWCSLQGWQSLSNTSTGEGTLRLLPSLKDSVAYIMLRSFFLNGDDEFDNTQPIFPGSEPGNTQFFATVKGHPHLDLEKSIVGISPVKPGDYAFWHCNLVHEVDKFHPGITDSRVAYNGCNPLTPYNLYSLLSVRDTSNKAVVPDDFRSYDKIHEQEYQHEDHGARKENIRCLDGMRAMGFAKFDVDDEDLTEGQRNMRAMANEKLGLA